MLSNFLNNSNLYLEKIPNSDTYSFTLQPDRLNGTFRINHNYHTEYPILFP